MLLNWNFNKCDLNWIELFVVMSLRGIYIFIPKTPMFQGYIVFRLFCTYYSWHMILFSALNVLYFNIDTFRITCAVPNMAVFCGFSILRFRLMLLRYFLKNFEIVPVALLTTGITFVCMFHMCGISIVRSLHYSLLGFFLDQMSDFRNCNKY